MLNNLEYLAAHPEYESNLLSLIGTADEEAPETFFKDPRQDELHGLLLHALGASSSKREPRPSASLVHAFTAASSDPDIYIAQWLAET